MVRGCVTSCSLQLCPCSWESVKTPDLGDADLGDAHPRCISLCLG